MKSILVALCVVSSSASLAQAPSTIDYSKLTARRDSFDVQLQGNSAGFIVATLEKTANGFHYVETTRLTGIIDQATTVDFTPAGVITTRQTGTFNGMNARIDLAYANGKVMGTAVTPSRTGMDSISVDTAIPSGTIDDNLLGVIVPGLDWKSGAVFSLPVLTSGKGTVSTVTLTVAGTETLSLPRGKVEAFKVDVAGLENPLTMWVALDNHTLVQGGPQGIPLLQQIVRP